MFCSALVQVSELLTEDTQSCKLPKDSERTCEGLSHQPAVNVWLVEKKAWLSLSLKKKEEDANILKIPEVKQLCREAAQESVALAESDIVNSVLHLHSHPHMNIIKL